MDPETPPTPEEIDELLAAAKAEGLASQKPSAPPDERLLASRRDLFRGMMFRRRFDPENFGDLDEGFANLQADLFLLQATQNAIAQILIKADLTTMEEVQALAADYAEEEGAQHGASAQLRRAARDPDGFSLSNLMKGLFS